MGRKNFQGLSLIIIALLLIISIRVHDTFAAPVTPFSHLATKQYLAGDLLAVEFSGTNNKSNAEEIDALFDGNHRTTSRKGGGINVSPGKDLEIQLNWKETCCITAIRLAFSGAPKCSFSWMDKSGKRHTLQTDPTVTFPKESPDTSYSIWENLAWNTRHLTLKINAIEECEITEIQVLGFNASRETPFLCIHRDVNLPQANKPVQLTASCYNPTLTPTENLSLVLDEYGDNGSSKQIATSPLPPIQPGTAISTQVQWQTPPTPGSYQLKACCMDVEKKNSISETICQLYITQPALHLVWYGEPLETGWTTAVTTANDDLDAYDWKKQGVLPLYWAPGMCKTDYSQADFERDWGSRIESKGRGIAIDEFGLLQTAEFGIGMANALLPIRQRFPDMPVYVWQAMATSAPVAPALRRGADLILHECYMEYLDHQYTSFDFMADRIREYGLTHNSVFGLACTSEKVGTSEAQMKEQFRYIRAVAPEFPGVAVYKAYGAGAKLAPLCDTLFEQYFLKPVLRVNLVRESPNRVVIQNIGQMTAENIDVELIGLPRGITAEKRSIDTLPPGYSTLVEWSLSQNALKNAKVHIHKKSQYEVVSTEPTIICN